MPYVPRVLTNGTQERIPATAEEDAQLVWEGWYPVDPAPPTGVSALDINVSGLVSDTTSQTRAELELYFESFADRTGATPGQILTLLSGGETAWQDAPVGGGTLDADDIAETATRLWFTPAEDTKLAGIAAGATVNATDAQLRDRTTHTGTQASATLSDLTETVQDIVAALLVAGTNVTTTYNDAAGTFTINATASGGTTDPEVVRDTIGGALVAGAGITITVNDAGDTITIASTAVLPTRSISTTAPLTGGGDLSANRTLAVSAATDIATGVVELATDAETQTGTDTTRAITPANLSARTATLTRTGVVELATDTETQTGTDTTRAITPSNLSARTASETATGLVELATTAEAQAGTDTARAVTPAGIKFARRQQVTARTTAHTAAAADVEKLITMTHAAAAAVTLPSDANDAGILVGDWIEYLQLGAGQTTFTAGAGASLVTPTGATAASRGQNCRVVAQKISANTYALAGDLA